jgi:hypothetical protein
MKLIASHPEKRKNPSPSNGGKALFFVPKKACFREQRKTKNRNERTDER